MHPRVDSGDPTEVPAADETDLDGHFRLLCLAADLGSYELEIGDGDCSDLINLDNLSPFSNCLTGPAAVPYPAGCESCDFDHNQHAGLVDFASFQIILALGILKPSQ